MVNDAVVTYTLCPLRPGIQLVAKDVGDISGCGCHLHHLPTVEPWDTVGDSPEFRTISKVDVPSNIEMS